MGYYLVYSLSFTIIIIILLQNLFITPAKRNPITTTCHSPFYSLQPLRTTNWLPFLHGVTVSGHFWKSYSMWPFVCLVPSTQYASSFIHSLVPHSFCGQMISHCMNLPYFKKGILFNNITHIQHYIRFRNTPQFNSYTSKEVVTISVATMWYNIILSEYY